MGAKFKNTASLSAATDVDNVRFNTAKLELDTTLPSLLVAVQFFRRVTAPASETSAKIKRLMLLSPLIVVPDKTPAGQIMPIYFLSLTMTAFILHARIYDIHEF